MTVIEIVTSEPFLSDPEVADAATYVMALNDMWVTRAPGMWTMCAARYLDNEPVYSALAKATRFKMESHFGWLYDKLRNRFDAELHPHAAPPGFHIFNSDIKHKASLHTDEHHNVLSLGAKAVSQVSITIPLVLPQAGGGLVVCTDAGDSVIEYAVGVMYTHDGATLHKIDDTRALVPGDWRITLQAHVVTLADGRRVLFF